MSHIEIDELKIQSRVVSLINFKIYLLFIYNIYLFFWISSKFAVYLKRTNLQISVN